MSNLSFDFDAPLHGDDADRGGEGNADLPRELILASAGSGKTYHISSRIIGLLAHGERAETIFASTFTRKAAGEILERVLTRLAEAAVRADRAAELTAAVRMDNASKVPLPATSAAWQAVLERVVAELHRMNVGTLDAFFLRTARSFAYEVGLPPGWRIIDEAEADAMRADALSDVLRAGDPAALLPLVRAHARDAVTRSVHGSLLRDARRLVDMHRGLDPSVDDPWNSFASVAGAPLPPAIVRERTVRIAARLRSADPPRKADGMPMGGWQHALGKTADCIEAGDWASVLDSQLGKAALAPGGGTYRRTPVPDEICAIFADARELARQVLGPQYAAQIVAQGRIAALLADALETRRRAGGGHGFDDITRLLGGPDALGERPDLYYRLDMRTRHLLLDEFQDTSLPQWEALEPLVDELLAGHADERAAVIVADPKQSIYGWRGASPLLVHRVGERYSLQPNALAKSWRSSQVVLDAVNRIFENVDTLPLWSDNEGDMETARAWRQAFEPHSAQHELPGYVELRVGPRESTQKSVRPGLCREAARMAAALHAEAPHRSIGILTRTNGAVARIMYELGLLNVAASEEGGVPLLDAAPVAALLALMKLADHPGDSLARYHVARTPLGAVAGLTDPDDEEAACRTAQRTRRQLLEDGYGNTLAGYARRLRDACDDRERRRLDQLVELAFQYDANASLRPTDFITIVESQRVEDPTAAQVRVMTVHQAKGLEFDVVILPQLDTRLRQPEYGPLPLRADGGAGRIRAVYPYVRTALQPLFVEALPDLAAAVRQRDAASLRDALSGLYVAVTRARHALYMLVAADGTKPSTTCSAARLLRSALHGEQRVSEGDLLYAAGDADWSGVMDVRQADAAAAAKRHDLVPRTRPTPDSPAAPWAGPLLRPDAARARNLPRRSPSELEGEARVEVRQLLRIDAFASALRGTVVHGWFEALAWVEDGVPPDDELRSIARRAAPRMTEEEIVALIPKFHGWLEVPEIRHALSRAGAADGAELERELPFLRREGDVVMEGVIDRLVLYRDARGVPYAEILDFKTDAIETGDTAALQQRTAFYRPQIDAYRQAVAAIYGMDAAHVRARLLFLEPGVVVDLVGDVTIGAPR